MLTLFENIEDEACDEVDSACDAFFDGVIEEAAAIKRIRRGWGKLGYSVDDDNIKEYLRIMHKIKRG